MNARQGLSPFLAALTAAALLAGPAHGQGTKEADATEALKKQIADLKKQVDELRLQNVELRRLAAEAARERERAEQQYREAMKALDRLFAPAAKGKKALPNDEATRELLEQALKFYRALQNGKKAKDVGDDGKEVQQKARDLLATGAKHLKAGEIERAEAAFRQALELQRKLAEQLPAVSGHRLDLARGYFHLVELHRVSGRVAEAQETARQAIALLEALVRDRPAEVGLRTELARGYRLLGAILRDLGRLQEAEETLRRATELEKQGKAGTP